MVGFIGFLVLAVGGGGLALYFGVPPTAIGAYVLGLLILGAITGFPSSGGSEGGGSGGGSGSGSILNSATDAANGFLDKLEGSNGTELERDSSRYPSDLQERVVGNPDHPGRDRDGGNPGPEPTTSGGDEDIDYTPGTNDEEYISGDNDDNNMSDAPVESLEAEIERVINELGEEEEREKQEIQELDEAKEELIAALKELQQHEDLEGFIIAINKEGLKGKTPAEQSAAIEKYAERYLGHEPGIQEIQQEIRVLADIEDKFETASKEMQDVDQKKQQDMKENQQAESELAEVASNLDHLLDASQELQHYFGG
ncbi:MAG: hypothetical protein BRC30_03785 [Nanohaloarchaea archaeon SW_7_46_7]|nr:MAG: hypothetical protein BRC30_03785 [Nanohaloarchaea archaeon SW_7_46_7]